MKLTTVVYMTSLCWFITGCGPTPDQNKYPVSPDSLNFDISAIENKKNLIPIVFIGSGPAGLSGAVYGAREVHTIVIQGNKPGGLLTETTTVENWPGERSIMGPDIVQSIQSQAEGLGAQFLFDMVDRIDFTSWPYTIYTQDKRVLHAMAVVICTGAAPRRLGVPGENEYWGMGVTSCAVCDAPFFKDEDVVVVGGGDSAVEEAIQLARHVKSATVLVRKDRMRAGTSMQERLKGYPNVSVRYNVEIKKITGDGTKVTGVEIYNNKTNETSTMPISGVFLAIGHDPNTKLFKDGIDLDEAGYVVMRGRSQKASLPGVYAAGDVEDSVYRQAGVAAGSGIKAALDALEFLREVGFDTQIAQKVKNHYFNVSKNSAAIVPIVKTVEELAQLTGSDSGIVMVDIFADYCPSCMRMLPVYAEAAEQFKDKLTFLKVDANDSDDIMKEYKVSGLPTILVFKDGNIIKRFTEAMDKQQLVAVIEELLDENQ